MSRFAATRLPAALRDERPALALALPTSPSSGEGQCFPPSSG